LFNTYFWESTINNSLVLTNGRAGLSKRCILRVSSRQERIRTTVRRFAPRHARHAGASHLPSIHQLYRDTNASTGHSKFRLAVIFFGFFRTGPSGSCADATLVFCLCSSLLVNCRAHFRHVATDLQVSIRHEHSLLAVFVCICCVTSSSTSSQFKVTPRLSVDAVIVIRSSFLPVGT
jgi:hypothetical protein